MNIKIMQRMEILNTLNTLLSNTKNSDLNEELYIEKQNIEEELIYLLVIERAERQLKEDEKLEDTNTIDMEKIKNNNTNNIATVKTACDALHYRRKQKYLRTLNSMAQYFRARKAKASTFKILAFAVAVAISPKRFAFTFLQYITPS